MYEIRPDSIKTFISDRSIKLPRFQRRQTWDTKKNFQLCISLFKNYPIGVCILSEEAQEHNKNKNIKYLLDGRQRRNALKLLDEDPENLYLWAKDFIKFKPNDQPFDVEQKFYNAISNFLEEDEDEQNTQLVTDQEADISEEEGETADIDLDTIRDSGGMQLLLRMIIATHKKTARKSGFTEPFDFHDSVKKLPYLEISEGSYKLISRDLKEFINNYRNYCQRSCDDEYDHQENFILYIKERYEVYDETSLKQSVNRNWDKILERINLLQDMDDVLSNAKIGVIEVKGMRSTDYQKIFNLINSQGEPLKAIEILSAKQKWNIPIKSASYETNEAVKKLYREIGTSNEDVVRWDLPATFLDRLGKNFVFKTFNPQKSAEFIKGITIGFKAISGIYEQGVTKESIEKLSSHKGINWDVDIDNLIAKVKTMWEVLLTSNYFKYFHSWKNNIIELTSDYVALDFFIITYLNWLEKGSPVGSSTLTRTFQKETFILLDRLFYQYAMGQWKSSADAKIKNNIEHLRDNFNAVTEEEWLALLNEIFERSTINGKEINIGLQKPLLYHFYCLSQIAGPSLSLHDQLDVDHIIPQAIFSVSTIENKEIIKDNILNLGLLPKEENVSKSNKRLCEIDNTWLKQEIVKYEFIEETDFSTFSKVQNYKILFEKRKPFFIKAFGEKRTDLLNN